MNFQQFREHLLARGLDVETAAQHVSALEAFERHLAAQQPRLSMDALSAGDVQHYVDELIAGGRNSPQELYALARYGRFSGNDTLFVAVLELLDGAEVLGKLHQKLGRLLGEARRDELFAGLQLPPLGLSSLEKARLMRELMDRLERELGQEQCRQILSPCLRDLDPGWHAADIEKYRELGGFDAWLAWKREQFIAELTEHCNAGTLYFSQPVTPEVIDWVRQQPEVHQGVRQGDVLHVSKIPYQAARYIAESDPRLKRYHYCHCPWARELLREGEAGVSPLFCHCSAGFVKKPLEALFGRELEVDVLQSVLQGDMQCLFAVHLPVDLV